MNEEITDSDEFNAALETPAVKEALLSVHRIINDPTASDHEILVRLDAVAEKLDALIEGFQQDMEAFQ